VQTLVDASTGSRDTDVVPASEWRKALMPLLGGCIGALVVGVIWGGWHEMEWILLGFVIATVLNVLVRWTSHRWTSQ